MTAGMHQLRRETTNTRHASCRARPSVLETRLRSEQKDRTEELDNKGDEARQERAVRRR